MPNPTPPTAQDIEDVLARQREAKSLYPELDPDNWLPRYENLILVDLPHFALALKAEREENVEVSAALKHRAECFRIVDKSLVSADKRTDALTARVAELEELVRDLRPTEHDDDCPLRYETLDPPSKCSCEFYMLIARIRALIPKEGE